MYHDLQDPFAIAVKKELLGTPQEQYISSSVCNAANSYCANIHSQFILFMTAYFLFTTSGDTETLGGETRQETV